MCWGIGENLLHFVWKCKELANLIELFLNTLIDKAIWVKTMKKKILGKF